MRAKLVLSSLLLSPLAASASGFHAAGLSRL